MFTATISHVLNWYASITEVYPTKMSGDRKVAGCCVTSKDPVRMGGFEPPAPCPPNKCSTRLSYILMLIVDGADDLDLPFVFLLQGTHDGTNLGLHHLTEMEEFKIRVHIDHPLD